MGLGLQHKTVDNLSSELELPSNQLLGLFNRLIRRCVSYLNTILEKDVEKTLLPQRDVNLTPVAQSMHQELEDAAKVLNVLINTLLY